MKGMFQVVEMVIWAVVFFIVAGLGTYILNEFGNTLGGTAGNIILTLKDALGNWALTWGPILLIVLIAIVIIGYVMFLGYRAQAQK